MYFLNLKNYAYNLYYEGNDRDNCLQSVILVLDDLNLKNQCEKDKF